MENKIDVKNVETTLNNWILDRYESEQRAESVRKLIIDLAHITSQSSESVKDHLQWCLVHPLCYQHGYKYAIEKTMHIEIAEDKAQLLRKYMEENYDI